MPGFWPGIFVLVSFEYIRVPTLSRLYTIYCRSWLASEGGLTADLLFVDRVHIHSCGNGHLWLRLIPVGAGLPAKAALQPTYVLLTAYISIAAVTAT
jgi:hypothetical protein